MDIDCTGMRMTPQPVQPAESLRERPHAARLRDEVPNAARATTIR